MYGPEFIQGSFVENIRLDIVGLLAILGEAPISQTSRTSCLTRFGFAPRLLPAPQAYLKTTRPDRLPTKPADVIGFHSGNVRPVLSHVGSLLLEPGNLTAKYQVQRLEIKRKDKDTEPTVTAAQLGPMTWLVLFGCMLWIALLGLAFGLSDGMAVLALLMLGAVAIIAHLGLYSQIKLATYKDKERDYLPRSDIIVVYPNGTFQIVSCDEEIARKVFIETERCEYKVRNEHVYRVLGMIATFLLMVGVLCLSNAKPKLQIAITCALITANASHWIVAALPEKSHWDLTSFDVIGKDKWLTTRWSESLWTVIACTGTTRWVRAAKIAPDSPAWSDWLDEAQSKVDPDKQPIFKGGKMLEPEWEAQAALTRYLKKYAEKDKSAFTPGDTQLPRKEKQERKEQ